MWGYCQDRAIVWLSRSFTVSSSDVREAYVELAYLYEQIGLLTDRLDRLSEQWDQGG